MKKSTVMLLPAIGVFMLAITLSVIIPISLHERITKLEEGLAPILVPSYSINDQRQVCNSDIYIDEQGRSYWCYGLFSLREVLDFLAKEFLSHEPATERRLISRPATTEKTDNNNSTSSGVFVYR